MAKYSFKARKYALSSSGLRKTSGRSGNPARSSSTGSHRTELIAMVHSRTATSSSNIDSRAVIVKRTLKQYFNAVNWLQRTGTYILFIYYMPPTSIRRENYRMMGAICLSVRLSVRLSVACLDLTRERKGLESPKLAGWKPTTRVICEPI